MVWKSGESVQIENLDNHLSSVERAKDELRYIQNQIQGAKTELSDINNQKHEALQAALSSIEHDKENLKAMRGVVNEQNDKNITTNLLLNETSKKLAAKEEDLNIQKMSHLKFIQSKEAEISAREAQLRVDVLEHSNNKNISEVLRITLEAEANKLSEDQMELTQKQKKLQDDQFKIGILEVTANGLIKQAEAQMAEAKTLKEQADKALEEANIALASSKEKQLKADEALAQIEKEKSNIKDLIIENKQAKLAADASIEAAKTSIANANQKIAELNVLKEALAQKEK